TDFTADPRLANTLSHLVTELQEFYARVDAISDPRTKKWLFVPSIWSPIIAVLVYWLLVWLLPKIMRSREAFQLTSCLVIYNAALTLLNLYIFVEVLVATTDAGYSYSCQELSMTYKPKEMRMFFLLRKKNNQVSFLHVYHHTTMVCLWWIGIKWVAAFLSAMINSLVHVFMYTYYGMSAIPSLRKYLWWKKHLTQFQLIQFCILLCHGVVSLRAKCDYPLWMQYALIGYMISFLILFSNFYVQSYFAKKFKKQKPIEANGEIVTNGSANSLEEKKKHY
ncbi:hypothetical protein pdam_00016138, partial [Pocillopora damicornis]